METKDRLIIALDRPDLKSALALAEAVGPYVGAFKVGLELFTAEGPEAIRALTQAGHKVFFDGKFHDIPNTVAGACRAAVRHGAWMLNIHASGSREMLEAAAKAVKEESKGGRRPILLGVTVLTSLDSPLLEEALGVTVDPIELVLRMSTLCLESGLDGVVASARDASAIRLCCGTPFIIVTPGIRRSGSKTHDQKRSATPAEALANGANFLVLGREITEARDPAAAAQELLADLEESRGEE